MVNVCIKMFCKWPLFQKICLLGLTVFLSGIRPSGCAVEAKAPFYCLRVFFIRLDTPVSTALQLDCSGRYHVSFSLSAHRPDQLFKGSWNLSCLLCYCPLVHCQCCREAVLSCIEAEDALLLQEALDRVLFHLTCASYCRHFVGLFISSWVISRSVGLWPLLETASCFSCISGPLSTTDRNPSPSGLAHPNHLSLFTHFLRFPSKAPGPVA